jgi:Domain of unknown function (DUF4868)
MPINEDIDMDASATLIVAWRSGRQAYARVLKAGGDVIEVLRSYAKESLQKVTQDRGRQYNPDDEQEDEDSYLSANQDELFDTALLAQIKRGSSLPLVSPDDLRRRSLALYALLVGNTPESRAIFVRRNNPVKLASKGLVAIFDQTLTRVTEPVLAFDSGFDLMLYSDEVWIFNQRNFEALFKESAAVLAQTAAWVDKLAQALPIADEGRQWLATRLRQNSVMRRKVQSILRSDYLSMLTPETLTKKMTEHGLDPARLIINGVLIFNKDTETDMLRLLNEDLWTGDFSGDQYAATRKAHA